MKCNHVLSTLVISVNLSVVPHPGTALFWPASPTYQPWNMHPVCKQYLQNVLFVSFSSFYYMYMGSYPMLDVTSEVCNRHTPENVLFDPLEIQYCLNKLQDTLSDID